MKNFGKAIAVIFACGFGAQPLYSLESPDRIPALVSFAPIDDGSHHIVLLINDGRPCGVPHAEDGVVYEGNSSRLALIMHQSKVLSGGYGIESGCWSSAGSSKGTVSYMNPASTTLWHHFHVDMATTKQMTWDWKAELLYPISPAIG
jgi:hypothetical protein